MAKLSFDFDALTVLSTASASPYWDQIQISISVTLAGDLLGQASGDLGFHGAGGIAPIQNLTPTIGTWPVVIDTTGLRPTSTIGINIQITNIRDMPTRDVERWIAAIALASAGGAAGVLLPVPKDLSTAVKALIAAGKGGVGGAIGKFFDGLFKDPPRCAGPAGFMTVALSLDDILYKPFAFENIPVGFGVSTKRGVFRDSLASSPTKVGQDCGTAHYLLNFAYVQEETKIAPPPTATRSLRPVRGAPIDAWLGQWAEPTFGLPRAGVLISRGSMPNADFLRVQVSEALKRFGGQKIVDADVDNRTVEAGHHFIFADDVWAEWGPFAGLVSDRLTTSTMSFAQSASAGASIEPAPEDEERTAVGSVDAELLVRPEPASTAPLLPVRSGDQIGPSLKNALTVGGIHTRLSILDEADTIFLPEYDLSLALYEETVHDSAGNLIRKAYVVRYSRSANIQFTRTDALLDRPMTIK